jgi:hypothetical protein
MMSQHSAPWDVQAPNSSQSGQIQMFDPTQFQGGAPSFQAGTDPNTNKAIPAITTRQPDAVPQYTQQQTGWDQGWEQQNWDSNEPNQWFEQPGVPDQDFQQPVGQNFQPNPGYQNELSDSGSNWSQQGEPWPQQDGWQHPTLIGGNEQVSNHQDYPAQVRDYNKNVQKVFIFSTKLYSKADVTISKIVNLWI